MIAEKRLHFITQSQTNREVGTNPPVILDERTRIPARQADVRNAGLNRELVRTVSQLRNLRLGESGLAQLQVGDVLIQRSHLIEDRVAIDIGNDLVGSVENREIAAVKRKRPVEALGIVALIALATYTDSETDGVRTVRNGGVVL